MSSWFYKISDTDKEIVARNLKRLVDLKDLIHKLGYFVVSSNSGGYKVLMNLINDPFITDRKPLYKVLKDALIGENNQKIALDAPHKFQKYMQEAETIIVREIGRTQKEMRSLK